MKKVRLEFYFLDHALGIKDANIEYQKNHLDALKNELGRANKYYDQILNDIKAKIDEESQDIKNLEKELSYKKTERETLRKKTETLRTDIDNHSLDFDTENDKDLDEQIKQKLKQVEEAEFRRKNAQEELNHIYEDWSQKLNQHVNAAYSNSVNTRDQEQLKEIKRLIKGKHRL